MSIRQLWEACSTGDNTKVQSILTDGSVDMNSSPDSDHGDYNTPLQVAMSNNHPSIVTTLLSSQHIRLEVIHRLFGWTGLHYACFSNSVACVNIYGRDYRCTPAIINMKDNHGETALMVAVRRGNLECVRELAELQGTDFATKSRMGETLLKVARNLNYQQIAQFLKERNSTQMTGVPTTPDVPECPVCMEEMRPPMQIFNCRNGHLICSVCRPNVLVCANCRQAYLGRATAVEQIIRQMFNCQ